MNTKINIYSTLFIAMALLCLNPYHFFSSKEINDFTALALHKEYCLASEDTSSKEINIFVDETVLFDDSIAVDSSDHDRPLDYESIKKAFEKLGIDLSPLDSTEFFELLQSIDQTNDLYYKIHQSIKNYAEVLSILCKNYFIELDPSELFKFSIQGIFENLDKFTQYYFSDQFSFDEATSLGQYTGLGINVATDFENLFIQDFTEESTRLSSGLKIGDIIYEINDNQLFGDLDELRSFTSAEPGTVLNIKILRPGITYDTLVFNLPTKTIDMPDIETTSIINTKQGDILYLKLIRFSEKTKFQVRKEILSFLESNNPLAVILDLRDNPGGILDAGLEVSGMFLPSGTTIAIAKKREEKDQVIYKNIYTPLDTALPIAILVNSNTASASELVCGAIQDNDRGVIIGQPTYGKGLIQNFHQMTNGDFIKITSGAYFTPSGRSIDKIQSFYFHQTSPPDTNHYYSKSNRELHQGNGIEPDISINDEDSIPEFIDNLQRQLVFLKFTARTTNTQPEIMEKIFNSNNRSLLLQLFTTYLKEINFAYKSQLEYTIDSLYNVFNANPELKTHSKVLENLKSKLVNPISKLCNKHSNWIWDETEKIYKKMTLSTYDYKQWLIGKDPYIQKAKEILMNSDNYYGIIKRNQVNKR